MDWFGIPEASAPALFVWIYLSIAVMPRMIGSLSHLAVVVLSFGMAIVWGADTLAPRQPSLVMFSTLVVIVATLLAMFHFELIFRRRHGYWRFGGKPAMEGRGSAT